MMRQNFLIILVLIGGLILTSFQASIKFKSYEEQAAVLIDSYEATCYKTYTKDKDIGQQFFAAFPASFEEFQVLFLSTRDGGKDLVHKQVRAKKIREVHRFSLDCIELFYRLNQVDQKLYYDKYVAIAVGACWLEPGEHGIPADELKLYGSHLFRKLFYNAAVVLQSLIKHNEQEITRFFQFLLSGPLPRRFKNRKVYTELQQRIIQISPTIMQIPTVSSLFDYYIRLENKLEVLIENYERAINLSGDERAPYEQAFLDAFPSSFEEVVYIFGYQDIKGKGPLYGYQERGSYTPNESYLSFFNDLQYVDKEKYYNKSIDICINGSYQADGIEHGLAMRTILSRDLENVVRLLAKRSDQDVKSVFFFMFDDNHPKNDLNQTQYNKLYPQIKKVNAKIARLFQEGYQQALATDDGHGH